MQIFKLHFPYTSRRLREKETKKAKKEVEPRLNTQYNGETKFDVWKSNFEKMKKKVSLLIQLEFLFHIDNVVVPFSSVISPDADFGEFELFSEANFLIEQESI